MSVSEGPISIGLKNLFLAKLTSFISMSPAHVDGFRIPVLRRTLRPSSKSSAIRLSSSPADMPLTRSRYLGTKASTACRAASAA